MGDLVEEAAELATATVHQPYLEDVQRSALGVERSASALSERQSVAPLAVRRALESNASGTPEETAKERVIMKDEFARPWWQTIRDINEFRRRLEDLSDTELLNVHSEIKAGIAVTQSQLAARDGVSDDWRKRATMAIGFLTEKRAAALVEIRKRRAVATVDNENRHSEARLRRQQTLREARQKLDAGHTHMALDILLRMFEEW